MHGIFFIVFLLYRNKGEYSYPPRLLIFSGYCKSAAISCMCRCRHLHRADYFSAIAATPGSTFPSRYSREAPPPVEMWLILSAKPSWIAAVAESPPPMIVVASASARASHTATVPFLSVGFSKTPIDLSSLRSDIKAHHVSRDLVGVNVLNRDLSVDRIRE